MEESDLDGQGKDGRQNGSLIKPSSEVSEGDPGLKRGPVPLNKRKADS